MRIRISVWKDSAPLRDEQWTSGGQLPGRASPEADAIIDQWMNDMHAGTHGTGHFYIDADFVDTAGGIASLYTKQVVDYPPLHKYQYLAIGGVGLPPA